MIKKVILSSIRFYQTMAFFHRPFFRVFFLSDRICRFTPTCSQYTYQAVKKYGSIKGLWIGLKRVVRCHPWNKDGYDPVQ